MKLKNSDWPITDPDVALKLLKAGNSGFALGKTKRAHQNAGWRNSVTQKNQQPFAMVLGCSDSRAPVELLFDRGIGDLFIVRVAGNVAGPDEVGSIEYSVLNLKTPLLVVLGHTLCGAVTSVFDDVKVPNNLLPLVARIRPSVKKVRMNHRNMNRDRLLKEAVKANVMNSINDFLKASPDSRKFVRSGDLKVEGALYDIRSGRVTWLGEHPKFSRTDRRGK